MRDLMYGSFKILLLLLMSCSTAIHSQRVSDKIYSILQSNHYCSRRLNSTHQMGCTSELGGNLGIVWIVEDNNDVEHILESGPTPPYVAVLHRNHFTKKNLLNFKYHLDRVAGVVFLDKDADDDTKSRSSPFSPEYECPNRYSGLYVNDSQYGDCKQNLWIEESPISGLMYEDIPYPIFLINEKKSIDAIESCFRNSNVIYDTPTQEGKPQTGKKSQKSYPLCGIQLDSFMVAASDSELCMNSHSIVDELLQSNGRRCAAVGNQNLFGFYKPAIGPLHLKNGTNMLIPELVEPGSVVVLAAKLSSLSMFNNLSPGADSTITSIVTLLAVAEALGRTRQSKEVNATRRNIAFALFDSEPFDYTGSERMTFEMNLGYPNRYFISKEIVEAPKNINFSSIDYFINIDQMANYPNNDAIYLHSDPKDALSPKLSRVFKVMEREASKQRVGFVQEDPNLPLPPSPAQTFTKASRRTPTDQQLLGLVLSNYGKKFTNLFYNGIYDDSHNVYQTSKSKLINHITQVATMIAKAAFELAFETDKTDGISIDKTIIEQLLDCYLIDADCHLFTRAWQAGQKLPKGPIETYKDPTERSDDMNGAITAHLLAYFIGDKLKDLNVTQCLEANEKSTTFNYQYVNGVDEPVFNGSSGVCVQSQVFVSSSISAAFRRTQDQVKIDERYGPSWTVSFNGIRNPVRLYLKPSPASEWIIFLLGIVLTIGSFIFVYHLREISKSIKVNGDTQMATST